MRTRTGKGSVIQLDYIIHIQEIKPWPPSQSLRSLRTVLIQWEHGDKVSGSTNQVVPSLGTGTSVGDGRIEFNESFRLPVTLTREMPIKGGNGNGNGEYFLKNCIEFNLYEPRRDKTVKGQLLGTAVLDVADCGIVKENLSVTIPINCKRTYRNTVQPHLFLNIQPIGRNRTSSSSRSSISREVSVDRNHVESVSDLMSQEYAEEAEVASFTIDDDVSSHSSQAVTCSAADSNGSSSLQTKYNGTAITNGTSGGVKVDRASDQCDAKPHEVQASESRVHSTRNSSQSSSIDLSSDIAWIAKKITSKSLHSSAMEERNSSQSSSIDLSSDIAWIAKKITSKSLHSSAMEETGKKQFSNRINEHEVLEEVVQQNSMSAGEDVKVQSTPEKVILNSLIVTEATPEEYYQADENSINQNFDERTVEKYKNCEEQRTCELQEQEVCSEPLGDLSQGNVQKQLKLESSLLSANQMFAVHNNFPNVDKSKNGKSVRSSVDSSKSHVSSRSNYKFAADAGRDLISSEPKDAKSCAKEKDSRIQHLEHRLKILEAELREAAAIEASIYSVIAEHGSSVSKVHAPARRLFRLYGHSNKQNPESGSGSTARSVVSGLVLVAKACGNDVPRLTFWLSNSMVLRVLVNMSFGDSQLPISVRPDTQKVGDHSRKKTSSPLKWKPFPQKSAGVAIADNNCDWDNPSTFAAVLEKVEAWIFSRIIESLWWQTFTPHMQSGATKAIRRSMYLNFSKSYGIDERQGNSSLELWKQAFRDACERICPVRAEGHDCGCLAVLSRLIMEQLVSRLDVAMFNAILRESGDEIPTDPVADPISDAEVLPIPAGRASFGAGAQLKNAIGSWSRWLTDLFGFDDDDLLENGNRTEGAAAAVDEQTPCDAASKSFHLLNALSDLMMLPKDMLLSRTIRKEVCPTFGPPVITRILNFFVPDEFCPDRIPRVVIEALNFEDPFYSEEYSIMNLPCAASPIEYQILSAASVRLFGESVCHPELTRSRSGSSLLKKSQTSDDELDELDSPLNAIIPESLTSSPSSVTPNWMKKENRNRNTVRHHLLREVWMNSQ